MQHIQQGRRGVSVLVQLGADRLLMPAAILLSLMAAAAIAFQIVTTQVPANNGFF